MADRSHQMILTALSQSLAQGEAVPLHSSRTRAGLFPSNTAGKQAAQKSQQEGWIAESSEGCCITEKGMRYLLAQVSPRQVLEDLVRALEARHEEIARLVQTANRMQASLEGLRANAERVLTHIETPPTPSSAQPGMPANLNQLFQLFLAQKSGSASVEVDCRQAIVDCLTDWPANAHEDCPLPTLYERVEARVSDLTLGQFQDGLRQLIREDRIYLHPWTGPLHEMPRPPMALLVGHEVAYYASLRRPA